MLRVTYVVVDFENDQIIVCVSCINKGYYADEQKINCLEIGYCDK